MNIQIMQSVKQRFAFTCVIFSIIIMLAIKIQYI